MTEVEQLRYALQDTLAALAVGMTIAHQFKPGATNDMTVMQMAMAKARQALASTQPFP